MPRSSYSWQNLGVKFCCCKQFSEYVSLSSLLVSLFVLLVPADCKHQEEGQITFAMSGPSAQNTIYKYIDYLELVMLGLYRHYCLFLKFLRQLSLSVEVTSRVDGWQSLCFFDSVFYCLWWGADDDRTIDLRHLSQILTCPSLKSEGWDRWDLWMLWKGISWRDSGIWVGMTHNQIFRGMIRFKFDNMIMRWILQF